VSVNLQDLVDERTAARKLVAAYQLVVADIAAYYGEKHALAAVARERLKAAEATLRLAADRVLDALAFSERLSDC
jgi:hypothetical protein